MPTKALVFTWGEKDQAEVDIYFKMLVGFFNTQFGEVVGPKECENCEVTKE
jgi:hypothetical protein